MCVFLEVNFVKANKCLTVLNDHDQTTGSRDKRQLSEVQQSFLVGEQDLTPVSIL